LLLDHRVAINAVLYQAASKGRETMVWLLADRETNANAVIYQATSRGNEATMQLPVSCEVDVDENDRNGETAPYQATST